MKVNLTKILPDLNAIMAYADSVSVGAKSGCIIHIVKQDPQWPIVYFANDMNSVYGEYVHSGPLEECDVAFRSNLFPDVSKGTMFMESTRDGVKFDWKKKGIDKSVIIPRESEIQSIVKKAIERDFSVDNKVNVTERIFAAFDKDIGVSELLVSPQNIKVKQFKPTGEESYVNTYDFATTAKGWGSMESEGDVEEKSVTIKTSDFTNLVNITGTDDFRVSVNGDKPLCVSLQMNDGTIQMMLSHMIYRL